MDLKILFFMMLQYDIAIVQVCVALEIWVYISGRTLMHIYTSVGRKVII